MYLAVLGHAHARAGQTLEARKILQEVKTISEQRYIAASWVALVHLGLNETDDAFDWLQRAVEERDPWITLIGVYPIWDPLREDRRYGDLVKQLNLEP